MSTQGRGRGRSGRGRFSNRGRSGRHGGRAPPKANDGNKTSFDYKYEVGGSNKTANECNEVTKYLLNYIQKTYVHGSDIRKALQERKEFDFTAAMPVQGISTNSDASIKKIEDASYEAVFKAEIQQYVKRKDCYSSNMGKAHALLWQYCSRKMQNKIQSRTDYDSKIENNTIELLNAIEEHALSYEENRYNVSIVADALRNLLNIRQKEDEDLITYTERFRTIRMIAKNQVGEALKLANIEKDLKNENPNKTDDEIREMSWERFTSYIYLDRADRDKYGSFIDGLQRQQSLKHDQYPKTLDEAHSVLADQRFDRGYKEKIAKKRTSDGKSDNTKHEEKKKDEKTVMSEITLAQTEGVCYCCGKKGHYSSSCRHNNKPKSEWHMNQAKEIQNVLKQARTTHTSDGDTVVDIPQPTSTSSISADFTDIYKWSAQNVLIAKSSRSTGVVMSQRHTTNYKDWILLDNQSTCHFFCNPKFVSNIRETNKTLVMETNAGNAITNQVADIKEFGETWFDPNGMTNVLSMALVEEKYKVTYDSELSIFIVHLEDRIMPFKKSPIGLYYYQPDEPPHMSMIQTVDDNKTFYTDRQINRAKHARQLLHTLGCPSVNDLKNIIRMNSIRDCPVTLDDIVLAERIYGKDIASLKGKSTRPRPTPVVHDTIEIPKELIAAQHDVELCIDTLFINQLPFLATVSKHIKYRTCDFVKSRKVVDYRSVLAKVIMIYINAGFAIKCIHADQEYEPVLKHFKETSPYIQYNLAMANEHVPESERNIRVIKERIRSTYHSLPFKAIPAIFIKELASETANKLNFFPPHKGISQYYSPRDILIRQRLDYKKHCSIPQFSYVQAYEETAPKNSQQARTLDCIYLRPANSLQGGHVVYHLATKSPIKRHKVTVIPITTSVIEAVERLAHADGMKAFILHSKDGSKFFDSTWNAGMDYNQVDPDNYDDIYEDPDYEQLNDESDVELRYDDDYHSEELYDGEEDQDQEDHNQEESDNDIDDHVGNTANQEDDHSDVEDLEYLDQQQDEIEAEGNNDLQETEPRRSTREVRITQRLQDYRQETGKNYLQHGLDTIEYNEMNVRALAHIIIHQKESATINELSCATTYSLKTAIKKFGDNAKDAAKKEMKQLHDRECWKPIDIQTLTKTERSRAMETIFFITEKSDKKLKGRTCADGSIQRKWMERDEVSSPTVSTEATMITGVIEAMEGRDVATCDIPNAFVQTDLDEYDKDGNRTIMRIRGPLVEILCEMDPQYQQYVHYDKNGPVLYVHLIKALYGMLVSAMLFYQKLRQDLIDYGFETNPYDPCVANKMIRKKQLTVSWHVDDLKISHVESEVVTEFLTWIKMKYEKIGEVKITRGKIHEYLGMKLNYTEEGKFTIDMVEYITKMVVEYFKETKPRKVSSPWTDNLFKVTPAEPLNWKCAEKFHSTTAQGLFACKRARPDIATAIAFLTTRVQNPTMEDINKLDRMMSYLFYTKQDILTLEADKELVIRWYVDAAFAVHPDMKSHTGYAMTFGKGAIVSSSRKQAINTRSSTEAELVAADDAAGPMLWTQRFLYHQGYESQTILYQDNQSTMLLEKNGRTSAGKRSRHLDIRLFFVNDLYQKKLISIEYCPTHEMIGDYFTKPTHGSKFRKFRTTIMNHTTTT